MGKWNIDKAIKVQEFISALREGNKELWTANMELENDDSSSAYFRYIVALEESIYDYAMNERQTIERLESAIDDLLDINQEMIDFSENEIERISQEQSRIRNDVDNMMVELASTRLEFDATGFRDNFSNVKNFRNRRFPQ